MSKALQAVTVVAFAFCLGSATTVFAKDSAAPKGPELDGTLPALTKIAGEGYMNSHAFQYLTELTDDIGARVTASPNEHKAEEWGMAKMKAMGLENVHLEKYKIWRGWTRGNAEGELLTPQRHKLHIDAMGWTGSTPSGGIEGDVVPVNLYDLDNEMKDMSKFAGKVVIVVAKGKPHKDGAVIFADFGTFLKLAGKAGAAAVIGGQGGAHAQGMNLTHTGILGFDVDFAVPVVSMTAEDQGQLERYIERGVTPRVRFNIQNTFTDGQVETANVVGEIRGRENPEQIFVVGGHLDSWDLAQGATDNGSGTAAVLGAAEAIARSGQRPRRTIRFVLFTGEEQGLDGSMNYMKQHQSELANHLGDLVIDEGQGPVKAFQMGGRDDLIADFQPFVKSIANIRPIKINDEVEFGTDTGPFSLAGLPGINMNQDSPEYKYTHHSAADALEAQKPEVLTENATLMALTAYWIADRPDRFATAWPAERTAKMLRKQGQYEFLKAFDLWPYGNLGEEEKSKQ